MNEPQDTATETQEELTKSSEPTVCSNLENSEAPTINTSSVPNREQPAVAQETSTSNLAQNGTDNNLLVKSDDACSGSTSTEPDEYAKHVTYNAQGEAIYTDPQTLVKYKWSTEKNNWTPVESSVDSQEKLSAEDYYKWCSETNQWIPKTETPQQISATETEFYKWDAEKNEWIPKNDTKEATYSAEAGTYTYQDTDGTTFLWDKEKNAWFPNINEDFIAHYQMQYGFGDQTPAVPNAPVATQPQPDYSQPSESALTDAARLGKKRAASQPAKWFDIDPEQNTKVYVNNLPLDITQDEFIEIMSKCGMIMRDPQNKKYKVKLYSEPDGQLKGDALCDYIKVESVELALKILDGYDVRGKKISVQRAKFQMRGEYNPSLKPKVKKKDKEKLQKMKEKLLDWRPEKLRGQRLKHERVIILKNLFTPQLFDKEVHLMLEYKKDLREECGKYGTVRKVTLYDRHPEGVAQIMMSDPDEADMIVQVMNGRFFGKRELKAEIWDGKTKYKIVETNAENEKRLDTWNTFLETSEQEAEIASDVKKDENKPEANEKTEEV